MPRTEAPDGGWGWMVVLGCSLMNLSTRSIEPSFGLLFGDLLTDLGVHTTGAAVIMSTLDAVINFSGFFVGPMIKRFGFRKVGMLGGVIGSIALVSTSSAKSMTHILLTYSLLGGLGFGLCTASTFVALNSYFSARRGQAVGLAMAGTALGFMAMPQVITSLLELYEFQGAILILGAIALNSLLGASLLQPVKWHLRQPVAPAVSVPVISTVTTQPDDVKSEPIHTRTKHENGEAAEASKSLLGLPRNASVASSLGMHKTVSNTIGSCLSVRTVTRNSSHLSFASHAPRKTSAISYVSHLDLMGSTMLVYKETDSEDDDDDHHYHERNINSKHYDLEKAHHKSNNNVLTKELIKKEKKPLKKEGCWDKFVSVMDFDLLLDLSYMNTLFGVSITYIAELSFKMIMPFFMANLHYSKRETAEALSVMAIADIIARIVVPPFLDRTSFPRRNILMVSLICVAAARSILAEQTSWVSLIVFMVIHGFFRGLTLINFPLVISEAVSSEKFPAALGLSMVSKGIFIVLLGPLAGWIRDYTESYSACLHAQSIMLMLCVLAWFVEYIVKARRRSRQAHQAEPS